MGSAFAAAGNIVIKPLRGSSFNIILSLTAAAMGVLNHVRVMCTELRTTTAIFNPIAYRCYFTWVLVLCNGTNINVSACVNCEPL